MQDSALLTQYARDGSEAAFAQLLVRHLPLVYRTCRRELESDVLAEDAAQVVFLLLARKAKTLRVGPSLAGWLYQTSVFVAKDVRKQEARCQRRQEAIMQETVHAQTLPASDWDTVEPLLNPALSALKPTDREAVLLRFLEGHTLAETGALLGLSEDAARMRVDRALEKLRSYLAAHGAAVTSVLLTSLLTTEATRPVPANAASTVMQGTLNALANGPSPNILLFLKGISHTMNIIKIKYAALAASVLLSSAAVPSLVHAISPPKAGNSIYQVSQSTTPADYYANRQPPIMETLVLPDVLRGNSAMAGGAPHGDGNMRIMTYSSPSSFKEVCRFYIDKLLPPGAKPQALGVEGNLKKQSGYSLEERQGISTAAFSQRTSAYTVSVAVNRGALDKRTAVTLIYGQN